MVGRVLLFLLLAISSLAADVSYLRLRPEVVNNRLKQLAAPVEKRPEVLRKAFLDAGCKPDQITEQKVPENAISNVICTIPGSEPGSIVVSAGLDYDSVGDELSVEDATLEMLPLLVQSFSVTKPRHSLVFIGFTGAKKQVGSNYYLSQLSKEQRKDIRGMIYLDHLGRSPIRYLFPSRSNNPGIKMGYERLPIHDPTPLNKWLDVSAKSVNLDYPPELDEFYFTHALSFEHKGIAALTLSSPAYTILVRPKNADAKMLSTSTDIATYFETYNLLCVYLMKLDSSLDAGRNRK